MLKKEFTIIDETGIHARPATILVQAASKFESNVELGFNGRNVNLKSIMGVMSLGVGQGAVISISVDGSDEEEALNTLEDTMKKAGLI